MQLKLKYISGQKYVEFPLEARPSHLWSSLYNVLPTWETWVTLHLLYFYIVSFRLSLRGKLVNIFSRTDLEVGLHPEVVFPTLTMLIPLLTTRCQDRTVNFRVCQVMLIPLMITCQASLSQAHITAITTGTMKYIFCVFYTPYCIWHDLSNFTKQNLIY